MKKITLTLACFAVSATTLFVAGCYRESPEMPRQLETQTKPPSNVGSSTDTGAQPKTDLKAEQSLVTPQPKPILATERKASQALSQGATDSDILSYEQAPAPVQLTDMSASREQPPVSQTSADQETYAELTRNATIETQDQPVSTFSIDVDTGAYSNVRRFLQNGQMPPAGAVRVEELINYFSYDYANAPQADEPFSVTTLLGKTPWNDNTRLMHIGLKGFVPPTADDMSANLVFLIDVSGSMDSPDKLGLLKSSISMLAHELKASDTVSIVVYAGSSGTALEPTAGNEHQQIDQALAQLSAGGSTNGAEGIELAYQLASANFRENGINRVILATDGDFNVGISDIDALKEVIRKKRESGIALTTLGFGGGNYNDHLMEQLADVGNGSYAYIDTLGEARKVLVDELQATLMTIAKDVKIQVEFNPSVVSEYRLIGYSNRQLDNEDFNNDRVDAGEIGAGHTVTALYEIALHGEGGERYSPSRYQNVSKNTADDIAGPTNSTGSTIDAEQLLSEVAEVRLRYKLPEGTQSQLISHIASLTDLEQALADANNDFRFSASVAAFGQLLSGEHRMNSFDYQDARELAVSAVGEDHFGYRAEYLRLVDLASSLERLSGLSHDEHSPDEG